ncbi:hypothetical protein CF149_11038 [Pseudomonas psychrophila]|nr:hypothetical protein CF149_11038 [Pseudomonas psychrophila]
MQFLGRTTETAVAGHCINYIQRVFGPHEFAFKKFDASWQLLSLHKQILSWIMRVSQQIV